MGLPHHAIPQSRGVRTALTSERSTGEQVRRGRITKAGNPRARRVLIEGAWTSRYSPRVSRSLQVRQESLPTIVRAIA
jgi:transposase